MMLRYAAVAGLPRRVSPCPTRESLPSDGAVAQHVRQPHEADNPAIRRQSFPGAPRLTGEGRGRLVTSHAAARPGRRAAASLPPPHTRMPIRSWSTHSPNGSGVHGTRRKGDPARVEVGKRASRAPRGRPLRPARPHAGSCRSWTSGRGAGALEAVSVMRRGPAARRRPWPWKPAQRPGAAHRRTRKAAGACGPGSRCGSGAASCCPHQGPKGGARPDSLRQAPSARSARSGARSAPRRCSFQRVNNPGFPRTYSATPMAGRPVICATPSAWRS